MDFNPVEQAHIPDVALRRNNIPRRYLNYQTSIECLMNHVDEEFEESMLSRLIWQIKNSKLKKPAENNVETLPVCKLMYLQLLFNRAAYYPHEEGNSILDKLEG